MSKVAVYILSLKDYLQAHSQISFIASAEEAIVKELKRLMPDFN